MSQDTEKCVKCGRFCGHDDSAGWWSGENLAICGRCKENLGAKFCAFFGLDGWSGDEVGIDLEWEEIDQILSRITYDDTKRVRYIVTDKEFYNKAVIIKALISE